MSQEKRAEMDEQIGMSLDKLLSEQLDEEEKPTGEVTGSDMTDVGIKVEIQSKDTEKTNDSIPTEAEGSRKRKAESPLSDRERSMESAFSQDAKPEPVTSGEGNAFKLKIKVTAQLLVPVTKEKMYSFTYMINQ